MVGLLQNTFKRMLKVEQSMFKLQVLKIIKSQIPHYGKKWKQRALISSSFLVSAHLSLTGPAENMKIVTAIYLNIRPDLRDEWLTVGVEPEELAESGVRLVLCLSSASPSALMLALA